MVVFNGPQEGVVKAMFMTKIKSVLAVELVVATLASAIGIIYQTQAAEPPKDAQRKAEEKPVPGEPTPQPTKTDRERMVGNWFIVSDDSQRKGEMWVITEDSILMHPMHGGLNAHHYAHRLDASKNPKQIDITISRIKGPIVGVIKGIYVLDGDELRLCLGEMGKDRPAAFPEKPKPGEVLVLQRAGSGATPQAAKEEPAKTDQELMVGEWHIKNAESKRQGELWIISKDRIVMNAYGPGGQPVQNHVLDAGKDPKQIDIFFSPSDNSQAIKGIYVLEGDELRLCLGERGKERPAAFPKEPKPGEVLILQRATSSATPPATRAQPAQKVLTPEQAMQQRPKEQVTVQFKVASAYLTSHFAGSDLLANSEIELTDGTMFSVLLRRPARDQIMRLGIEPARHFAGKVIRVTGQVQPVLPPNTSGEGPFWIVLDDLQHFEVVRQ